MNAQVLLKENAAKAVELAKAVETTAGALAEVLEKKSGLIAETLEKQSDALAGAIGSKAGPIAKAVEVKADVLGEALEEKLEQARKEAMTTIKDFKFGQREAILLGVALGIIAVVAISRRIDREKAAERLRVAGMRAGESAKHLGARVSESAQGLGAKVSPAVANVTSKAGELAGQVKQEVSTRASGLTGQSRPTNGRDSEGAQPSEYTVPTPPPAEEARTDDLDEARQRLSGEPAEPPVRAEAVDPVAAVSETEMADQGATDAPAADSMDEGAVDAPAGESEPAAAPSGALKVSDGMKVVAFDGTDIGRVQETREDVFVLDRPRGADLLVPMDQVARIEGTVVYLRVETGQVAKMGWAKADPQ
jgi:hypothetical protein